MNLQVSFAWELIPEIFVSGVKDIIKFQTRPFHLIFHKVGSADPGPPLHYAAINWGCWVISHDALKTSIVCLYATAAGH